jgi:CRP-like cAMP-binding protein
MAPRARREGYSGNRLLAQLSEAELDSLAPMTRRIPLRPHDLLHEPGRAMRKVYFPLSGVISLMTPLEDGSAIETATIGREGMAGMHAVLGGGVLGNGMAMAQVPGEALAIDIDHFRATMDSDGKLRSLMLAYAQALFAQISQSVACNAAHEIHERCARWFLETHDRVDGDEIELTQEVLADMLGVTRPSVSVAARTLQSAGLVRYRRGHITVLDREALEEASCECYAVVRQEYERLVGTG